MVWLAVLCILLAVLALVLGVRLALTRRAAGDIARQLADILSDDTNSLITLGTGDREMRRLAAQLNRELRVLREQRLRYKQGDQELKAAVTNVSHDLRTPLTAICGYLELLQREEKSENVARYLGHIENRTEAMKALTEELFRYSVVLSTAEDMEPESVDLNAAIEESAAAFYAALTAKGISPEIHMPQDRVVRDLNRAALSRVLSNLFSNALKYSDGDLAVTLTEAGEIAFSNIAAGLDQVQVGKLFDRFFSVEAARSSTGLGLAIAKTLVERMGGTIGAEYGEERLTIRVNFPSSGE